MKMHSEEDVMERNEVLADIAKRTEEIARLYGRRHDIRITFKQLQKADKDMFDRTIYTFMEGEELFIISDANRLLYSVCVTGDSFLTAASELMNLVGRKF